MARRPRDDDGTVPALNGLGRVIGSLEAQMATNTSAIANLTTRWEMQDQLATEGRRKMHDKIDAAAGEVRTLQGEVRVVTQEVAELKNDVGVIERWKGESELKEAKEEGRKVTLKEIGARRIAIIATIALAAGGAFFGAFWNIVLPAINLWLLTPK